MVNHWVASRGRFDLDQVVGLVVRRWPVEADEAAALRFVEGLELFRSIGFEIFDAWPEGQQPRPRWRRPEKRSSK